MNLVDTHAHLYWDLYKDDLDQVIQRSLDASVTTIINVGVDVEKSEIAAKLESNKVKFYSTIGIHPHEAFRLASLAQGDINKLEQIYLSNPAKIIAVGECGLDYAQDNSYNGYNDHNYYNFQKKLFQLQIDLAKKLNLPLIVHCRDDRSKNPQNSEAWDEVLQMTKDHFGIYHCYSGLLNTTYKILNTNFLISLSATITYPKNEYLREAVKILPLEKIVLETDCPFLPPQSKRGQRNEPANVKEIAQLIADLKGVAFEEIARQTTENVKIMFNLR